MSFIRIAASTACIIVAASPALAGDPSGLWMRGDGNAQVRIAQCGSDFCAVNTWIGDTSGGEAVGDRLIMSVSPASETTLRGSAFDPQRDMTFSVEIEVGDSSLVSRGCIVGGLLCRSVRWTRIATN
ncbi:MAG: DUF2147 domain-containing protein [Rhizobiaceae bacterium]